jgi:hypothetical protein
MTEVPVHILPQGLSIDKLKEIVIKDNGSFGEWDMDMLANEWDDLPLTQWGVPVWNTETEDTTTLDEVDDKPAMPSDHGYNIQYVVIFNNEDEQDRWYAFLEWLKRKYDDVDTIAERILLETDKLVRDAD